MKVYNKIITQNRIISEIVALFTDNDKFVERLSQLTNLVCKYENIESIVFLSLDKNSNALRKASVSVNITSDCNWIPDLINLSLNNNFYLLISSENLFLTKHVITAEKVLSQRYNWSEMNDLVFVPSKLSTCLYGLLLIKHNNISDMDEVDESFFKTIGVLLAQVFKRYNDDSSLNKALLEADNANKIKTSFLANMSHEIRTPVNSILGLTDLLADPDLTIDQREEFISLITKSARSLVKIFDNILDASKIDAGQLSIKFEEVFWPTLFKELVSEYTKLYEHFKVKLIINAPDNDLGIYFRTDSFRFKQVISHIVENAFKYTESGHVAIGYEINDKNELIISVRDTGIGISDDIKDSVFEFFNQKQNKYTRQSGSTGLGLALANRITGLLRGKMWFETKVNVGTTFFIKFPDTLLKQGKIIETTTSLKYPNLSDKTFIVAEDVEINYMLISELLSPTKAKLLWAKNGKEALEVFKISKADLIIMDIQMPVMNGYEAIVAIRDIDKSIPIITQTAFLLNDEKQKSFELGANDFIAKPIKYKDLIAAIQKNLKTE